MPIPPQFAAKAKSKLPAGADFLIRKDQRPASPDAEDAAEPAKGADENETDSLTEEVQELIAKYGYEAVEAECEAQKPAEEGAEPEAAGAGAEEMPPKQ